MLDSVVVIPVTEPEINLALGMFRHLSEVGHARHLPAIISADLDIGEYGLWKLQRSAKSAFGEVKICQPNFRPSVTSQISRSNFLISTMIMQMVRNGEQQLILLPPRFQTLHPDWVQHIQSGLESHVESQFPCSMSVSEWLGAVSGGPDWFIGRKARGIGVGVAMGPEVEKTLIRLSTHSPRPARKRTITIRRWAAIGDVIACTSIAKQLNRMGHDTQFISFSSCAQAIRHSPFVENVMEDGAKWDVNLDQSYETHPHRSTRHIQDLFFEAFRGGLPDIGLGTPVNAAPVLGVTDQELSKSTGAMEKYPRPWTVICSRSNMAARSVPSDVMGGLVGKVQGTLFWAPGTTDPAPPGIVDLHVRDVRSLMGVIAAADLVVSVDSAPLHMAAGLKKPIIAIRQSFNPDLRVSDQRDVTTFQHRTLTCIPCDKYMCPINHTDPPCGRFESSDLANAINRKLEGLFGERTSAIIPVFKTKLQRLNRCLTSILPQVDEVVIGVDGNTPLPEGTLTNPKIKVVQHHSKVRRGYGKTCNYAARESTGRYLLMLNDDCYAEAGMVKAMVSEMKDQKVACAGGLLRYPNGTIQHGGTFRGATNYGHLDHGKTTPSIRTPVNMEFVTFASALVRRISFFSIDGFDERFDCYAEDSDMCLRLRRNGWKVRYTPQATAIHEESQTTSSVLKNDLLLLGNNTLNEIWGQYFHINQGRQDVVFPS